MHEYLLLVLKMPVIYVKLPSGYADTISIGIGKSYGTPRLLIGICQFPIHALAGKITGDWELAYAN